MHPSHRTSPTPAGSGPGGVESPAVAPVAWPLLLPLAAVKLLVHALVWSGYGFHQDEFYYLACGRRPAWGYVDQPPLVPLLGRLIEWLAGGVSLTSGELRCGSALAGAGTVFLAGCLARELGGGRCAQALAALAVLTMPLFLATGELFQTVVFDQLCWALTLWLALRTLRTAPGRGWLLVGLAAGIGLEAKHTMGLLGLGLAAALVLTKTGRRHLRSPWPWIGGGVAVAILLPNLWWQHAHGWPTAEFIHNNNAWNRREWTLAKFLVLQAVFVGPGAVLLLAFGVWSACRPGGNTGGRFVLCLSAVVFGTLIALDGKTYYAGPIYPALAAVGSVALEGWGSRWAARPGIARRWWPALAVAVLVLGVVPLIPAMLPIVPPERLAASWELRLNDDFGRHVGWPELVAQVQAIVHALPEADQRRTTILSVNYEAAAAIEHFDPALAASIPVVSPHNSYWLWGPGARDPQIVLVIGARRRDWLDQLFGRVERVGTIDNRYGVPNEWRGRGIWLCRDPKQTLRSAWLDLKDFD